MSRSTSLKLAHMRSCPPSPLLTDRSPLWSDLSSADNKWPHYTMKARPIKFPSVRGVHESLQSLLLSFIFQTPPLLPNNLKIGTTIIKLIIFQIEECLFFLLICFFFETSHIHFIPSFSGIVVTRSVSLHNTWNIQISCWLQAQHWTTQCEPAERLTGSAGVGRCVLLYSAACVCLPYLLYCAQQHRTGIVQ